MKSINLLSLVFIAKSFYISVFPFSLSMEKQTRSRISLDDASLNAPFIHALMNFLYPEEISNLQLASKSNIDKSRCS